MTHDVRPVPEYGDHMTKEDFIEAIEMGLFNDYDGSGEYATQTRATSIRFIPSTYDKETGWPYVVWYNN
jgi:hypothetical protein